MKILLITNIPAPYRLPIYELLDERLGQDFKVIFCASLEPNRKWTLGDFNFNYVFLKKRKIYSRKDKFRNNYIHFNPDVIGEIRRYNPDIIINTGFNPTNLLAWFYTLFSNCKHIVMTDGTKSSESDLSLFHKMIRKVVFKTTSAYIGASIGSYALFAQYGIDQSKCFKSCLCVRNEKFINERRFEDRKFDVMFSGQFLEGKLPFFFVEVVKLVKYKLGYLNVLILGDGPLREPFIQRLNDSTINFEYAGFVDQEYLPYYYGNAKILLFPTLNDPWGVVVNEAMASGTNVITTSLAGVADDLVLDRVNGFIVDIDANLWADRVIELLFDKKLWQKFSENGVKHVQNYNFKSASEGIYLASKNV